MLPHTHIACRVSPWPRQVKLENKKILFITISIRLITLIFRGYEEVQARAHVDCRKSQIQSIH